MNDGFITALNTQRATANWIDALAQNLTNIYTPGYRENQFRFNTFLGAGYVDQFGQKVDQGKSLPGTSPENMFLEGKGFFVVKTNDNQTLYTRLGEFKYDDAIARLYRSFELIGQIRLNNYGIQTSNVDIELLKDKGIVVGEPVDLGTNTLGAKEGVKVNIEGKYVYFYIFDFENTKDENILNTINNLKENTIKSTKEELINLND